MTASAVPPPGPAPGPYRPLYAAVTERARSHAPAVVELTPAGTSALPWSELATRVHHLALGLGDAGVRPGQRVGLLITPGADLTTAAFACLRLGAVVVLAEVGPGVRGLRRAIRLLAREEPDHVIGVERAIVAARVWGLPGRRFVVYRRHGRIVGEGGLIEHLPPRTAYSRRRVLGIFGSVRELLARGAVLAAAGTPLPAEPAPGSHAAVLLPRGAARVVHTHRSLAALRDAVAAQGVGDRFVAGSALFGLVGTALGSTVATLDLHPRAQAAADLAAAVADVTASADAAEPGAGRTEGMPGTVLVLPTTVLARRPYPAAGLTVRQQDALAAVRTAVVAGAPVTAEQLALVRALAPSAELRAVYGTTGAGPLAAASLEELRAAEADAGRGVAVPGAGGGVCVGAPLPDVTVRIQPLDDAGVPAGEPTTEPGVLGELVVAAPRLLAAPHLVTPLDDGGRSQGPGPARDDDAPAPGAARAWHRTGDVGYLDAAGRLWLEGRLVDVIVTARGVLAPAGPERAVVAIRGVVGAGVVGLGPVGDQRVVVVVETDPAQHAGAGEPASFAPSGLARAVHGALGVPVAAVLRVPALPADGARVDRTRLAAWAGRMLAGERAGNP